MLIFSIFLILSFYGYFIFFNRTWRIYKFLVPLFTLTIIGTLLFLVGITVGYMQYIVWTIFIVGLFLLVLEAIKCRGILQTLPKKQCYHVFVVNWLNNFIDKPFLVFITVAVGIFYATINNRIMPTSYDDFTFWLTHCHQCFIENHWTQGNWCIYGNFFYAAIQNTIPYYIIQILYPSFNDFGYLGAIFILVWAGLFPIFRFLRWKKFSYIAFLLCLPLFGRFLYAGIPTLNFKDVIYLLLGGFLVFLFKSHTKIWEVLRFYLIGFILFSFCSTIGWWEYSSPDMILGAIFCGATIYIFSIRDTGEGFYIKILPLLPVLFFLALVKPIAGLVAFFVSGLILITYVLNNWEYIWGERIFWHNNHDKLKKCLIPFSLFSIVIFMPLIAFGVWNCYFKCNGFESRTKMNIRFNDVYNIFVCKLNGTQKVKCDAMINLYKRGRLYQGIHRDPNIRKIYSYINTKLLGDGEEKFYIQTSPSYSIVLTIVALIGLIGLGINYRHRIRDTILLLTLIFEAIFYVFILLFICLNTLVNPAQYRYMSPIILCAVAIAVFYNSQWTSSHWRNCLRIFLLEILAVIFISGFQTFTPTRYNGMKHYHDTLKQLDLRHIFAEKRCVAVVFSSLPYPISQFSDYYFHCTLGFSPSLYVQSAKYRENFNFLIIGDAGGWNKFEAKYQVKEQPPSHFPAFFKVKSQKDNELELEPITTEK